MIPLIRTNFGLLAIGIATFILMGAGQSVYGPSLPVFARDFTLTLSDAGWLVSAHWIGCAAGVILTYLAGAAITPRHALAAMAAGAAGIAAGAGWWTTLAAALVFGLGYGLATVVLNPRVLRAFGPRGPAMLSLLNATFGIGAIGAPLAFVALGNDPGRTFWIIAATAGAVFVIAALTDKREAAATTATAGAAPFRPHWPILGFGAIAIGMEACLIGLGPTALIAAGETEVRAAELLSAFFVTFLSARVILIFTAHLMPSFTLWTGAMAGAALSAAGAVLIAAGPFFVAMGFFAGLFFPGYYVTASRKMGTDPRVAATIIGAGLVGGISSPILLASVLEGAGGSTFFWLMGTAAAGLTVAGLACLRRMNA